jgi:hypothetical protein
MKVQKLLSRIAKITPPREVPLEEGFPEVGSWKKAKQREESSSSKVLPPAGEDDELHSKGQKLQKSLLLLAQSITSNFQE